MNSKCTQNAYALVVYMLIWLFNINECWALLTTIFSKYKQSEETYLCTAYTDIFNTELRIYVAISTINYAHNRRLTRSTKSLSSRRHDTRKQTQNIGIFARFSSQSPNIKFHLYFFLLFGLFVFCVMFYI